MLALGLVTLSLIIALFTAQALLLDYFLITILHPACWVFGGADVLLLLYMLSSYNTQLAATKGGIAWLFYSWILLGKIVLYYWLIFGKLRTLTEVQLFGFARVDLALYLTPVIYCVLAFRASRQLYGSHGRISIESMLHADMVVHVMLDLLDSIICFQYADLSKDVTTNFPWLRTFIGVFVIVGLFMHSYSFPTTSGASLILQPSGASTSKGANAPTQQMQHFFDPHQPSSQGDVFLTRKHAALVAMFLVDIPFLFVRIYLKVRYPDEVVSPFLVKNIIFLPLQAFRLNQCRLAEKEKAKASQRKTFAFDSYKLKNGDGIFDESIAEQKAGPAVTAASPLSTSKPPNATGGYGELSPGSHKHQQAMAAPRRASFASPRRLRYRKHQPVGFGGDQEGVGGWAPIENPGDPLESPQAKIRNRQQVCGDCFSSSHAVSSHGASRVTDDGDTDVYDNDNDLASLLNTGGVPDQLRDKSFGRQPTTDPGNNDCLEESFHDGSHQRYFQRRDSVDTAAVSPKNNVHQVLKEVVTVRRIPVRGFSIWKLCSKIIHCLRVGGRHGLACLLDETFVLGYWKQVRIALPIVLAWSSQIVIVSLTYSQIQSQGPVDPSKWTAWNLIPTDFRVFIYIWGSSTLLMWLFWIGTAPFLDSLYSSFFWNVRFVAFFLTYTTVRDSNILELQHTWKLPISTASILIWIFVALPAFRLLDALFAVQSAFLGRRYIYFIVPSATRSLQNTLINTVSSFNDSQTDKGKHPRSDESGWMTTSSVLIFLNCRHSLAPISFNELLIGPDIVKDVRLMDTLVVRSWMETMMIFILHCFTLMVSFNFVSLGVFSGHILVRAIYNIFSQAVRLLALRRYELKATLEDIVQVWRENGPMSRDQLLDPSNWLKTREGDSIPSIDDEPNFNTAGEFNGYEQNMLKTKAKASERRVKKQYLSALDVIERYQRHGFFTSPGDMFPSYC